MLTITQKTYWRRSIFWCGDPTLTPFRNAMVRGSSDVIHSSVFMSLARPHKVDSQIIVTARMQFGKFCSLFIICMNLHKSFKPLT